MKHTPYSRNLLALCRKMRTWNWELDGDGAIRRPNPGPEFAQDHCPLSYCGNAPSTREFVAGGRRLGFEDSQSCEIARVSDHPAWHIFSLVKLRRILLKAARLKEKGTL